MSWSPLHPHLTPPTTPSITRPSTRSNSGDRTWDSFELIDTIFDSESESDSISSWTKLPSPAQHTRYKQSFADIIRESNQHTSCTNNNTDNINSTQIGYGIDADDSTLTRPDSSDSFTPFTVLSRWNSNESNFSLTSMAESCSWIHESMPDDESSDGGCKEEEEYLCDSDCEECLWDMEDRVTVHYYASGYSLFDICLAPHSTRTGFSFRGAPGVNGANVSSKLYRVRHRKLSNFPQSKRTRRTQSWDGLDGLGRQLPYFLTKDPSSLKRLQDAAKGREVVTPLRTVQPKTNEGLISPYRTTPPRPPRQPKEPHVRYLRAHDDDSNDSPSRRELIKISHSLSSKDRLAMIHASDKYRQVIRSRIQRQQAAKQQRAQKSNYQPKYERPTSASQIAYRRSAPRRSKIASVSFLPPPQSPSPRPNYDINLFGLLRDSTPSLTLFDQYRSAVWKRFAPILQPALASMQQHSREFNIGLVSSLPIVRQRFINQLRSVCPIVDDSLVLGYHYVYAQPSYWNFLLQNDFDLPLYSSIDDALRFMVYGPSSVLVIYCINRAPKDIHLPGGWKLYPRERCAPMFIVQFEPIHPRLHTQPRTLPTPDSSHWLNKGPARALLARRHTQLRRAIPDHRHGEEWSTMEYQSSVREPYCFPCVCTPSKGCCCNDCFEKAGERFETSAARDYRLAIIKEKESRVHRRSQSTAA